VILRQFDKNNAKDEAWRPCPKDGPDSWCGKLGDRWSSVLVNAVAPHLYSDFGGLVLDARTKLFCAYSEDGDSSHESKICYDTWPPPPSPPRLFWDTPGGRRRLQPQPSHKPASAANATPPSAEERRALSWTREHTEEVLREDESVARSSSAALSRLGPTAAEKRSDGCIPGCMRKGQQCRDVGRAHNAYLCSFPPEQLKYAMEAQLQRESFTKRNNEMVIDLTSVEPRLPHSIEGFFYVAGSPDYKEAEARDAYDRFMTSYSMDAEHAPPLMVLDMLKPRPFSLDPSLSGSADVIPY